MLDMRNESAIFFQATYANTAGYHKINVYRISGNDCVCLKIEKIANENTHAIFIIRKKYLVRMRVM